MITRNNLAHWRGMTGDPAGAAADLEELLIEFHQVLGSDHSSIVITRKNLVYWRSQATAQK
ncbi:hypothetical protein ACIBO2_56690 [Nonomuraea sp. NPDC050022]|uniref:hypothetical protein n=1 Tax=Nonomuraea sp. NPDC050022 TaxID=3364358 RepID=UPI003790725B